MIVVNPRKRGWFIGVVSALFWVFPSNAHAYLDGGTGSMISQVLMAGVGGLLVMLRLYWKNLFNNKPNSRTKKPE